ncbi:glycosyltransferase family 117 protein [Hymenobacter seoulensis]
MSYSRLKQLLSGGLFLLSLCVYWLTLEPTASFWDCGEFTASAYKLLVPHPPGAPLYLLLGRLASLLALGEPTQVAVLVNMVSAVASAATVALLFGIITDLAERLVFTSPFHASNPQPGTATALVLSSGVVGALAFAFSDSFWFNAVEAEVYALSTFGTALVVWLMLQWEKRADDAGADRWLLLIAYVIGLGIGVHLLNLLAIPVLCLVWYFRRAAQPSWRGVVMSLLVGSALVLVVLEGIIPGLPTLAGASEVFFVNTFGLPYNSGLVLFLLLFGGLLAVAFRAAYRLGRVGLHTALLGLVFVLIGYSSYLIVPIRSSFNPTINENAPNEVLSFVSYLRREQYGDRPLLYGPHVFAQPTAQEDGAPRYTRQNGRYEATDHRAELRYEASDKMLLPRIYSGPAGTTPDAVRNYRKWVADLEEGRKPTMGQNLRFMWQYQFGHMFWRYFGWNFIGRESDVQHAGVLWPWNSDQAVPASVAENRGRNALLGLPFLLGVVGLAWQARRNSRQALVVALLFALTGLAIVFYLNQPPQEPRERDYTFAGATMAFCIWIGLGVPALHAAFGRLVASARLRLVLVSVLGLAVPALMALEGWDDHDRTGRFSSIDYAKNVLNTLAPNAILITEGDNDTFPLWYAQEVEGVRPDVRVMVSGYLNTDWYVEQMRQRNYQSAPLPLSISPAQYRQGTNDYLPFVKNPAVKELNVREFVQLVSQNSPLLQVSYGDGSKTLLSYPSTKLVLPIDTAAVRRSGIVPPERLGQIVPRMEWQVSQGALEKKNLALLDVLATNNWQRPVYFANTVSPANYLGLEAYLQLEGLACRLLPCRAPAVRSTAIRLPEEGVVAKDLLYDSLMRKYSYRNLDNPKVYYDENQRFSLAPYRQQFARLARAYTDAGNLPRAREVLHKCLSVLPDAALPYDAYTPDLVPSLVAVGETERAKEIMDTLTTRTTQHLAYYASRPDAALFDREIGMQLFTLQHLYVAAADTGDVARANELAGILQQYGG